LPNQGAARGAATGLPEGRAIVAAVMRNPRSRVLGAAERLFPGYFAFVMASGIVAIACHLQAIPFVPTVLGAINWVAYGILGLLTLVRLVLFPRALLRDFADHQRGPGFFTMVAGSAELGTQAATVEHAAAIAGALWYLTTGLWCLIMYGFLVAIAVAARKPEPGSGIDGGWLIAVVATQSVVVLAGALGAEAVPSVETQFLCLVLFLAGGMLYIMVITLIFHRVSFFPLEPEEFGLYWIDMGAAAISVLAGSTLVLRAGAWPILQAYTPFLRGATVFFWAAASFWIPFLVAMTIWRYLIRKDVFRYEPAWWGVVFPLGMYASATFDLARAEDLPFLDPLCRVFTFVGLGAWLFALATLLASALSWARSERVGF
jgi:tellurite resistance protein TehA-like permease